MIKIFHDPRYLAPLKQRTVGRRAHTRRCSLSPLLLTMLLALSCLSSIRIEAQGTPPTGVPPSPNGVSGKPNEQGTDSATGPSEIFKAFQPKLEEFLKINRRRDPVHETYHFVVLLNTANTEGAAAHELRRIYHDLLFHYLLESPEGSDRISYVPFQLHVRNDIAKWDRPFTMQTAQDLYGVPDSPEQTPNMRGGNDVEGSLLEAVAKVKAVVQDQNQNPNQNDRAATVYIVLSDSETSQHPLSLNGSEARYTLTKDRPDFAQKLSSAGLDGDVQRGSQIITNSRPDGTKAQIPVYWRIYTPTGFRCLATLTTAQRGVPAPIAPKANTAKQPVPAAIPASRPAQPADESLIYLLIGGAVLVIGAIAYTVWLLKPRRLRVGYRTIIDDVPTFTNSFDVKFGQQRVISGTSNAGEIAIPGLPANIQVATLSINLLGAVVLASEAWNVSDSPVQIHQEPVDVRLSPMGGVAMPGTDEVFLRVERVDS